MLTEYVNSSDIRAVLGVSPEELEDATLALPLYETFLVLSLDDVETTLAAAYLVVSAIVFASRTATQKRFHDVCRLFCAYAVARQLLTSLPYFAEWKMQDGRAAKERVKDPYQLTREGVEAGFAALSLRLSQAYSDMTGGTIAARTRTRVTLSRGVGLALDPVTNA